MATISSEPSNEVSLSILFSEWWLRAPETPDAALVVSMRDWEYTHPEKQSVIGDLIGRSDPVVMSDNITRLATGTLKFWVFDWDYRKRIEALVLHQQTLLFNDNWGSAWYVRMGDAHHWTIVPQVASGIGTGTRDVHEYANSWTEVKWPR